MNFSLDGAAVIHGVVVVLIFPDLGVELKPVGDGFVSLTRMPDHDDGRPRDLVHGSARHRLVRQGASVGRVGGIALIYQLVMSTTALTIGLIVGNSGHTNRRCSTA